MLLDIFKNAATESGTIIVNYTVDTATLVESMIDTNGVPWYYRNVKKGILV